MRSSPFSVASVAEPCRFIAENVPSRLAPDSPAGSAHVVYHPSAAPGDTMTGACGHLSVNYH